MNYVIPAKAGIHVRLSDMDPRFRGDDAFWCAVPAPCPLPPEVFTAFCSLLSAFSHFCKVFPYPDVIPRLTTTLACGIQ